MNDFWDGPVERRTCAQCGHVIVRAETIAVKGGKVKAARPIGVMKMVDQGEADDKIIGVHVDDPEFAHYTSIDQLPPHRLKEVKQFFEEYKRLEQKSVVVSDFQRGPEALQVVRDAIAMYKREHKP